MRIMRYYEDAKLCQAMPSSSYPCQGGQEAPAHQWEHEVPLGPGAAHQIETPKKTQCNDSSQWWHKSWIWVCIHVTEAAANINAMSFCFLWWTQRVSEFRFLKLTLQERSQFMKEEASQLYTTVVIRHSAYLTAYLTAWIFRTWWCRYMSIYVDVINSISTLSRSRHMPSWRHLCIPRTEPTEPRATDDPRAETWPHWTTARKSVSCGTAKVRRNW